MGSFFRLLLKLPIFRPLVRFLVGVIAIPLFKLFVKKITRQRQLDAELEKDLEQWFRGSLLLLAATANMEHALFGWVPLRLDAEDAWVGIIMRLMLAIGVTEAMPDQELFSVIHPGPPKLKFPKGKRWLACREQLRPFFKGLVCQHLNRSSQVFAIMTAIFTGWVGWICYVLAIVQYLIIGLVTSRDKAFDVLSEFDQQVQLRRRWLIDELQLAAAGQDSDDWIPLEAQATDPLPPEPAPASEPPRPSAPVGSPINPDYARRH